MAALVKSNIEIFFRRDQEFYTFQSKRVLWVLCSLICLPKHGMHLDTGKYSSIENED